MIELESGAGFIPAPYSCTFHDPSLKDKSGRCKPCRLATERERYKKKRSQPQNYDTTCGNGHPKVKGLHCEVCKHEAQVRYQENHRDAINARQKQKRKDQPERFLSASRKSYDRIRESLALKREQEPKTCTECGKSFVLVPPKCAAKYCSDDCRSAGDKRRRKSHKPRVKEKVVIDNRRQYIKNRAERIEYQKRYAQQNPEKVVAVRHRRRAREMSAPGEFTAEQFSALCLFLGNRCFDCGYVDSKLTVGHAIPLARGGSNWIDNIIPQCLPCNLHQHDNFHPEFEVSENTLVDFGLVTFERD